jgi:hypothetical protein
MSKKRKEFGIPLKAEIMSLASTSDIGSSFLAGLHRYWIDFKTDYIDDDLKKIISEIEFGEKRAIEDYANVLKENTMLLTTRNL